MRMVLGFTVTTIIVGVGTLAIVGVLSDRGRRSVVAAGSE